MKNKIAVALLLVALMVTGYAVTKTPISNKSITPIPSIAVPADSNFTVVYTIYVMSGKSYVKNREFIVVYKDNECGQKIKTDNTGKVTFSVFNNATTDVNVPIKGITDTKSWVVFPNTTKASKYWKIEKRYGKVIGSYRYVVDISKPPIKVFN